MDRITATHAFPCKIVNYVWADGGYVDQPVTQDIGAYIAKRSSPEGPDEYWLMLEVSYASMMMTAGSVRHTSQTGWLAQAGTRPVKVDGSWGGRNYPEMFFAPETMTALWKTLAPDLLLLDA